MLIGQFQHYQDTQLKNQLLVSEISKKVKDIVCNDKEPEANNDDHIGVQYIVNYQGLIQNLFDEKWETIDADLFDISKKHYEEELFTQ